MAGGDGPSSARRRATSPARSSCSTRPQRVLRHRLLPDVRPIAARTARVRLAQGDVAAARRWATERGLAPDDEPSYVHEYEHLTLARVLLAEAADDPAGGSLDDARRLLTASARGGRGRRAGWHRDRDPRPAGARPPRGRGTTSRRDTALDDALRAGASPRATSASSSTRAHRSSACCAPAQAPTAATRHARRLLEAAGTVAPVPAAGDRRRPRRRAERPRARRAPPAAQRPQRAGHRPRAATSRSTRCGPTPRASTPSSA